MCKPLGGWFGVVCYALSVSFWLQAVALGQIWTGLGDGETWADGSNWDAGVHPQVPGSTAQFDSNFGVPQDRIQNTSNIAISGIEVLNAPGVVVVADDEPADGSFDFELDNGGAPAFINLDPTPGYSLTFAEGQPLRLLDDLQVQHDGTTGDLLGFHSNLLGTQSIDLAGSGRAELLGRLNSIQNLSTDIETRLGNVNADGSLDFLQVLGDVTIGVNSTTEVGGIVSGFANLIADGQVLVEPEGLIVANNDLIGLGHLDVLDFGRIHAAGSALAYTGTADVRGSLSVGSNFGGPAGTVNLQQFGIIGTTNAGHDPTGDPAVIVDPSVVGLGEVGLSIDVPAFTIPVLNPNFNNGVDNAFRVGSETLGSIAAATAMLPFDNGVLAPAYILGGEGRLDINASLADSGISGGSTALHMPIVPSVNPGVNRGSIVLNNLNTFTGPVIVEQEQLVLADPGAVAAATTVDAIAPNVVFDGGNYQHGTIVLDPALLGGYFGPAPNLMGGALGFSSAHILTGLPTVTGLVGPGLYDASNFGGGSATSSLLALGGTSFIDQGALFVIDDSLSPSGDPVVLITTDESVVRLNLPNNHTGGTAIVGFSTLEISDAAQLGPGPLNIADGAELVVTSSTIIGNDIDMHDATSFGDSGIRVVVGQSLLVDGNLSTNDAPQATFTKRGGGQLVFDPLVPWLPGGQDNAWGLRIEAGDVVLNQLPEHDPGFSTWQTGPLVLEGTSTSLAVTATTIGNAANPGNAGFRLLQASAGSDTKIDVDLPADLKLGGGNGSNQLLGRIEKTGAGELWFGGDSLGSDAIGSRFDGRGELDIVQGTVRFGNMPNTDDGSRAFPNDIVLRIQDQALLIKEQDQPGSVQSLYVNDLAGAGFAEMVLSDLGGVLGDGSLNVDLDQLGTLEINGILRKLGNAPLRFSAQPGATISINGALRIDDGTVEADGSGIDPFTDTTTGVSLDVDNNSTADGLRITAGTVQVNSLIGTGRTRVEAGAKLEVATAFASQDVFDINGELTSPVASVVGQLITGSGVVNGDVVLTGAALAPNNDLIPGVPTPATLTINGDLSAGLLDEVNIDLEGATGVADQVMVSGTADFSNLATLTIDPHSHFPTLGPNLLVLVDAGGGVLNPFGLQPSPGDYLGYGIEVLAINYTPTTVELELEQIAYADFNNDGVVDSADLAIWSAGYGTGTSHNQGDANLDGIVNGLDFLVWQRQAGSLVLSTQVTIAPGNVPEPSACWLMAIAAGLLNRRYRTRFS